MTMEFTKDIYGDPIDWDKWINEFWYNSNFKEITTFDAAWRKFLNKERERHEERLLLELKELKEQSYTHFKDDD